MVFRLPLGCLIAALLVAGSGLHAQTVSSAPAWAAPVDDATGQQMVATPITPGTPALHASTPAASTGTLATHPAHRQALSAHVTTAALDSSGSGHTTARRAVESTVPGPEGATYVIPAGTLLSRGLADYVSRFHWSLRWLVPDDYRLDLPLPIPAGSMTSGVTYVVHAYQAQGGLIGAIPRFANPNKVVVIQPVTAAKDSH